MIKLRNSLQAHKGFSLAEVVIAIGVVTFCVLALVGMLPMGFKTIKAAREETGAANCLEQIANSLRAATTNAAGEYRAMGVYSNLSWSSPNLLTNLSLGGVPTANGIDQRLAAHVEVTAQPTATSPGMARISVAWPNTAEWKGDNQNLWTNAQGSVSTWVVFLPQP